MNYTNQMWQGISTQQVKWSPRLDAPVCAICGTQLIPAAGSEWFPCSKCVLEEK